MFNALTIKSVSTGARILAAALVMAQAVGCGGSTGGGGDEGGAGGQGGGGGAGGSGGEDGSSPAACDCIAAYGSPSMDEAALKKLQDEGLPACFPSADKEKLAEAASCLPQIVGQHAVNGKDIHVYYFCSDVCPDYGGVGVAFAGIKDVDACCAIGGIPLRDPAWGGFQGCVPPELDPMVPWTEKCEP